LEFVVDINSFGKWNMSHTTAFKIIVVSNDRSKSDEVYFNFGLDQLLEHIKRLLHLILIKSVACYLMAV